ncbi:extracellular solute-binding protein [Patescibacteria group bacterium]|nr:extracellular solute-binding protein [Patescibacteria group bacterium]
MGSKKTLIIVVVAAVLVIGAILAFVFFRKPSAPEPFTVEFWGVFDNSDIYRPLIAKFQQQYPFITINYYKKNVATYEKDLIDALAAGRGPDIFFINNAWLPKHIDKLSAAPESVITVKQIRDAFVDVVTQDFIYKDNVYALPLSVDTLALFYNKDLLNSAGIASPPAIWDEFNADVELLTKKDAKNNILLAGATLGTAQNVNRSTDILSILMMQGGAKMISDDKRMAAFDQGVSAANSQTIYPGEIALLFYTNFANPVKKVYTWNSYQHYSLDAFVEGKAAMMISYSYQIPLIRARSPHLNFAVAALPQISKNSRAMSLANYWGLAASKTSKHPGYAWTFMNFLASQENLKAYLEVAQKPSARRDLIDWQSSDENLGVFARQALIAKSWWEVDNLAIETIFAQMIESVVANKTTIKEAIQGASQQITLLMQQKQQAGGQ